ncbi:MAG TPA: tripartite tricarboxylate transporter substrate-binding protein [Xanthobacteraceae bacterium]|jgi:tripartite-type tricarboxylate transporter receptor subunit TctC
MMTCEFSRLRRLPASAIAFAAIILGCAPAALAQSAQNFYAGKQITLLCGAAVGGGYDADARLLARHLGRFIPGNPSIIVQNQPAAGSLVATNQIYNTAPKDGTVVSLIQRGMLTARLINPGQVRFDLAKLNWIGNLATEVGVALAWHTAPHKSAKDLFDKELIVGGHAGVDPELTPRLYNAVLGTKFKIINGYNGTADIALAMERGEVAGIGDWSWSSLKQQRPQWISDGSITLLLQSGLEKDPELPNLPSALDFAKTESDRKVLELFLTQKTVARPIIAPPGVPPERIAVLRKAFASLANDAEFLADAKKANLEVNLMPGQEVEKIVSRIASAPHDVVERYTKAFSQSH